MAEGTGRAALALVFNALVWGLSWWPLKTLQAAGLHPLWSTALVFLLALVPLVLLYRDGWRHFAHAPLLWLLALACGLTNLGFNWAVTVGDVVRVVLLFYLMPAWSVGLAWWVLGERPTVASLARVVLGLAGVAIVLQPEGGLAFPLPRTAADWLALGGGLSFALTNVLLRRLHAVAVHARVLAMFGGGVAVSGVAAASLSALGMAALPPAPAAMWMLVAAALAAGFLLSNLALQYGASRLPAHTTALLMLSEVVFASLSSVAAGAASLTGRTLIGGALILGAAAWSALPSRGGKAAAGAEYVDGHHP